MYTRVYRVPAGTEQQRRRKDGERGDLLFLESRDVGDVGQCVQSDPATSNWEQAARGGNRSYFSVGSASMALE